MAVAAASAPVLAGVVAGCAAALAGSGVPGGVARLGVHAFIVAAGFPLGMALFGGLAQMRDFVLVLRRTPLGQG